MDLSQYQIDCSDTLLNAAKAISLNKSRCVVVTTNGKSIGIFSEGDLIRALLKGSDIHSKLKPYINHGLIFLEDKNLQKALRIFKKNEITFLPVLSNNLELLDVILLGDILRLIPNDEIIE
jgi:predicted transcriptional regulator